MSDVLPVLQQLSAELFSAVILLVVFFLIARVARARQSVALAFTLMPIFAAVAVSSQLL